MACQQFDAVQLSNGVRMPLIGFGTFRLKGETCKISVEAALACGYRHIDTATCYGNETEIGQVLSHHHNKKQEADAKQADGNDIFLTSKVQPRDMHRPGQVLAAFEASLSKLQVPRLDLYLIHWPGVSKRPPESPQHAIARRETWRTLEDLYLEGKARAIGVSNFTTAHLRELMFGSAEECSDSEEEMERKSLCVRVIPHVNQVELHPEFQQKALRRFCGKHGIQIVGYSPFGVGALFHNPLITSVVERHRANGAASCDPATVLLKWSLQQGIPAIPKATRPEHIRSNFEAFSDESWSLSQEDFQLFDSLDDESNGKKTWDPKHIQ